jgi:hypothetical protein
MQVIEITSLTGHSPYDITICDITKTYCYIATTGVTSVPTIVEIPSELLGTEELLVVIKDSAGCETFSKYNCFTPTPTPTPTITPTITPTNISCNCISIQNPSGVTLNFGYTQCDGTQFYGSIYSATTLYVCGKHPYGHSGLTITVSSQICIGNVCSGPFPTPTPTPSHNPTHTPTPTPSITPTYTPTHTSTPTPTTVYSLFKTQSCCNSKIVKYVMLPSTFLPGTAIVSLSGECLQILNKSETMSWVTDYWNHLTTYVDCDLCIKNHPC